jgi:dolichol-phosphate mannosyltransferase
MCREEAGHSRFFKKWSEIIYYRILGLLSSETTFYRFAGYALLDRRVVSSLARIETRDPYLRGLIGDVGFSHHEMTYREDERSSGSTKYNLRQMLRLALTGLTATSTVPLYLPLVLGFVAMGMATIGATLLGLSCVMSWPNLPHVLGWAVAMLAIVFLSGVQLLCVGILGIYIGKVVIAGKRGPSYIVAERGGVELE